MVILVVLMIKLDEQLGIESATFQLAIIIPPKKQIHLRFVDLVVTRSKTAFWYRKQASLSED